jgi:hypothetical protein
MAHATLIVTYGRKENVLRLVEVVISSGVKKIYISIDGPRSEKVSRIQTDLISELELITRNFSGEIIVWRRKLNMGSGASVIASLDWVFSREEEVCILEDDLIIDHNYFKFMEFGLRSMSLRNPNLKIVTGTNPFGKVTQGKLGKINYPVSWGWATNRNNWLQLRSLIFSKSSVRVSEQCLSTRLFWETGKRRALSGQIEAWDIPLASEMSKTDYYTLVPPSNLVRNIGFDEFASHTGMDRWPLDIEISDIPNLDLLDSASTDFVILNKNFEEEIFRIRPLHSYTWIVNKVFDRFRFRNKSMNLLDRTKIEGAPTR